MKIYNLILLNFYFLQLFPLLFGMNRGGPSGSQQGGPSRDGSRLHLSKPMKDVSKLLNGIRPWLERVGNKPSYSGIAVRPIGNPEHFSQINNVRKQYENLNSAYKEISTDFESIIEIRNNHLNARDEYHNDANELIGQLNAYLQNNMNMQTQLLTDVQTFYGYVHLLYIENMENQNEDAGTSGQGQHEQWQLVQYGQGQHQSEGSGLQQPVELDDFTRLRRQILPLLERVGELGRCSDIRARKLEHRSAQPITNVRGQYNNLVLAYVDLSAVSNGFNEALNHYLTEKEQNPNDPYILQRIQQLNIALDHNNAKQNGIIVDLQKLYDYINPGQAIHNEDAGTSGHRGSGSGN